MKIKRKIERTIELTAREVYDAIAAKYDLPINPQEVYAVFGVDERVSTLGIEAVEYSDQEMQA